MKEPRRILIVRTSSLGDIIHTLPAFQSLRVAYPQAGIDWLVEKRAAFLLRAVPGIDRIVPIDTCTVRGTPWNPGNWQDLGRTLRRLRAAAYDLSIDFQGLLKTGFLSWLSGARRRLGFSKELVRERPACWFYTGTLAPGRDPIHVIEINLRLAQLAGATGEVLPVRFDSAPGDIAAVERRLEETRLANFVVINPGGGWPTKLWHSSAYAALADRVQRELELRVVVTTGPGEEPLYQQIAGMCRSEKPVHLQIPFLQLIPLYLQARMVIGGDTGPFHLACLLGRPVVGIFGPTSPVRNGHFGTCGETVTRTLPCSFCYGRVCPTKNECMEIPVVEVFAAVERCLAKCP